MVASQLYRSPHGCVFLTVPPEIPVHSALARRQLVEGARVLFALERAAATPCRQLIIFNQEVSP